MTTSAGDSFFLAYQLQGGGDLFLHFLAGLEFHRSSCGNVHSCSRLLGISPDFGCDFPNLEGTEISQYDRVALGEAFGDSIDQALHHFLHILLSDGSAIGAKLVGDFNDQFAFCYRCHFSK